MGLPVKSRRKRLCRQQRFLRRCLGHSLHITSCLKVHHHKGFGVPGTSVAVRGTLGLCMGQAAAPVRRCALQGAEGRLWAVALWPGTPRSPARSPSPRLLCLE